MHLDKYKEILVTNEYLDYEFTSIGPKGDIPKIVQFRPTEDPRIVNLAFGNRRKDGSIDDVARDGNNDRNKILATVFSIINFFYTKNPDKWVFFAGSTPERTRLYRMVITLNLDELSGDYDILGVLEDMENRLVSVPFQKEIDYFGFLIKKKND